jgi:hypothetical protein
VSFAAITLCVTSEQVFIVVSVYYRLSPGTFVYTRVLNVDDDDDNNKGLFSTKKQLY